MRKYLEYAGILFLATVVSVGAQQAVFTKLRVTSTAADAVCIGQSGQSPTNGTCVGATSGDLTLTRSTDGNVLNVLNSFATFAGEALTVNTSRAANTAFDLLTMKANAVTQYRVKGNGDVVGQGSVVERGRAAAMGEWTTFTPTRGASAGTWTAGTVSTAAYMLIGKTMWVAYYISGTTVSNAGVTLTIAIPGGFTASAKPMSGPMTDRDNGGAWVTGAWDIQAGATVIRLYNGPGFNLYGVSAGNTDVFGIAQFEVQ